MQQIDREIRAQIGKQVENGTLKITLRNHRLEALKNLLAYPSPN